MRFYIQLYLLIQLLHWQLDFIVYNTEWPKKSTGPINFFITSTKIEQNNSNFVHSNFCLCMIIPKSFSNLGCFAQQLRSLQNTFQMTSSALETDLQPLRKIVNHSHAVLSGDFPDFCYNLQPWAHQLFEDCSYTHGPSDIPTNKNQGSSSPVYGVPTRRHTSCWSSLSWNRSLSQSRVWFDVWGVAPSCCNHMSSRSVPLRRPSDVQNFLSIYWVGGSACNTKVIKFYQRRWSKCSPSQFMQLWSVIETTNLYYLLLDYPVEWEILCVT